MAEIKSGDYSEPPAHHPCYADGILGSGLGAAQRSAGRGCFRGCCVSGAPLFWLQLGSSGSQAGRGVEALFHRLDLALYVGERVEEVFRSL